MKQPKPWYRVSKSAWYVEHNFKQVRLGEHPAPGGGVQLPGEAGVVEGVRAVGAAKRTAVGQLGDERVRPDGVRHR
jgi:hypothetical protein